MFFFGLNSLQVPLLKSFTGLLVFAEALRASSSTMSLGLTLQILLLHSALSHSLSLSYCSSNSPGNFQLQSIYQSLGLCQDTCNDKDYAFAVVSGELCYCSNIAPSEDSQLDLSSCYTNCPGYPREMCASEGCYGYLLLDSGLIESETTMSETTTEMTITEPSTTSPMISATTILEPSTTAVTTSEPATTETIETSTRTAEYQNTTSQTPISQTTMSSTSSRAIQVVETPKTTTLIQDQVFTPTSFLITTPTVTSLVFSVVTLSGSHETEFITTEVQQVTTITRDEASIAVSTKASLSTPSNDTSILHNGNNSNLTNGHSSTSSMSGEKKGFFRHKGWVATVFTIVGVIALMIIIFLLYFTYGYNHRSQDVEDQVRPRDGSMSDSDDEILPNIILRTIPIKEPAATEKVEPIVSQKQVRSSSSSSANSTSDNPSRSPSVKEKFIKWKSKKTTSASFSSPSINGNTGGITRDVSIISDDYGTPIINNRGDSTYIDQRLDFDSFKPIHGALTHSHDDMFSLGDDIDYSRRVLKLANP